MSRLTSLIHQVSETNEQLAAELKTEVEDLLDRRAFGLNFERHIPETVDLPGRPVRRGDKVRMLPPRGRDSDEAHRKVWIVERITDDIAHLLRHVTDMESENTTYSLNDLVVVAEFRDPIYPGLVSTGKVERGGDGPYHTVINAENYHALQLLAWTHEGRIDAIYIDPPYNTGEKDWKYNNDYVDDSDTYRHSKWLAMMERRLVLAKRLLKPAASVLIVTIDEREVHRLALLLEQLFSGADMEMVTSIINLGGRAKPGKISPVEEYLFVLTFGDMTVRRWVTDMIRECKTCSRAKEKDPLRWRTLIRGGKNDYRESLPNQFYPIYIDRSTGHIHSVGDALPHGVDRTSVTVPPGTKAIWPLKPDGREWLWGVKPGELRRRLRDGFVRVSEKGKPQYVTDGKIERVRDGSIEILEHNKDGSVAKARWLTDQIEAPKRVWNLASHSSQSGGSTLLNSLLPDQSRFDYPKSLFAVEDVLRMFVGSNPDAIVLDFFAGSGTTAHAVMRLNKQHGGRRQAIVVTNNEVSSTQQDRLRKQGLRPGDTEWEQYGICEHITKPRICAAITGRAPSGKAITGWYRHTDEFPMSQGFGENAEFFELTYESKRDIVLGAGFRAIAPLLWMRAGSRGRRIEKAVPAGFDVADTYGVLFDMDATKGFLREIENKTSVRVAFVLTDDVRGFQAVCGGLPRRVEPVRLFDPYLNLCDMLTE
ncbi:MAG: site-specific DNA-methyltransferase [Bacteroidota bacterium]|nr:site-specific DNA-methyltransferase [Bacteroidota bacterium]